MKTRVIAGAVLVVVLLLLVLVAPKWLAMVCFGLLLAIQAYELLYVTGLVRHPRLLIYSAVMALLVTLWSYFDAVHAYLVLGVLLFTTLLFAEMMLDHIKVRFEMIAMCIVAGLLVPYLLTALVRILMLKIGKYMILIPFIIAYANDAGAYFAGLKLGKHKLAPVVSPNKTIEGLVGGIISGTVGMLLYAVILQFGFRFRVNYIFALIYGFFGSCMGVMGDLFFSVIKRQTGIKDYGNLIPGHGGVLDRFDSVVTVAPMIEVLLVLLPVAVG